MKKLIYIFSFLMVGAAYAQDTSNTRNNERQTRNQRADRSNQNQRPDFYEIVDTTEYTMDEKRYLFTPVGDGEVRVQQISDQRNGQIDIGNLRRTTADGYYMMITTPENELTFGRFDDEGNFRFYRYDRDKDTIIEENFRIEDPVQRRDQNRRNRNRGRNNDRNNSNSNSRNNN